MKFLNIFLAGIAYGEYDLKKTKIFENFWNFWKFQLTWSILIDYLGAYEPAKVDKKPQRFLNKWNGTLYHPLSNLNDREKDRYNRKMSNRLDKVLERYHQFKESV